MAVALVSTVYETSRDEEVESEYQQALHGRRLHRGSDPRGVRHLGRIGDLSSGQTLGTAGGAIAGGIAGYALSGGAVGVAIGAAAGGLIGNRLGNWLEGDAQNAAALAAARAAESGERVT
jgi:hypothetical protein